MPTDRPIRRALIAVYDKTGIAEFARALVDEFGIEIISTGGTAKHLKEAGIPVTMVEEVTGFPEMLDGRVKTLHPKIHAGILADRDNPEHMRQLEEHGIKPIDMVVVNLYPFEKTVADPNCKFEDAIEMIDIGGPCMLRAAAKNHRHVLVIDDTEQYDFTLGILRDQSNPNRVAELLCDNSCGAFWTVAQYDAIVSNWLSRTDAMPSGLFRALHFWNWGPMRYGENPHQSAELLSPSPALGGHDLTAADAGVSDQADWQAKISFNNYVDANAALALCAELTRASLGSAKLCFADGTSEFHSDASQSPEKPRGINDDVYSRRKLPHWQRPGATYWITFKSAIGPLAEDERDIVLAAIKHWDRQRIRLISAVVMPDHVHALVEPLPVAGRASETHDLPAWLQSVKAYSGREISQRRGGLGQVWIRETFDRWIRSESDLDEKYRYIANNPIKEGLATHPEAYRWWYGLDVLGIGMGLPVDAVTGGNEVALRSSKNKAELRSPLNKAELRSPEKKAEPCPPENEGPVLNKAELWFPGNKAEPCPPQGKAELCSPQCVFVKHTNACGVGVAGDSIEAYRRAYLGDPNAAMGGILAVNFPVTTDFAELVMETYDRFGKAAGAGGFFVEVWVAPSFDDEAVEIIRSKKKWGANVRLLAVGDMAVAPNPDELEYKTIAGGMLVQSKDLAGLNEDQWKVVTKRQPTDAEMADLRLAWLVAKHTKSNAISICKDGMLIGNGAGQMSRVMSCRIATWLAKENGHADKLPGSAAASDAFFPFRDGPDILIEAGVTAIIQPGGSKRDEDTIAACNERGVAMIFTGTRHFKH